MRSTPSPIRTTPLPPGRVLLMSCRFLFYFSFEVDVDQDTVRLDIDAETISSSVGDKITQELFKVGLLITVLYQQNTVHLNSFHLNTAHLN